MSIFGMPWQDAINGLFFELGGGYFISRHVVRLYKDKLVRGVDWIASAFFMAWGFWNLYYYPHLGQWLSFVGGIGIVSMNAVWVAMMLYYIRKEQRDLLAADASIHGVLP